MAEDFVNEKLSEGILAKEKLDTQSTCNLEMCRTILTSQNAVEMMDDISEDGIGAEFWRLFQEGKTTTAGEFFRW